MLPQPDIILTIHGVGEHAPGIIARELSEGWGTAPAIQIIDFNWNTIVESGSAPRIKQLSSSLARANGHISVQSALLRARVDIHDFLWGAGYLALTVCPLLFIPLAVTKGLSGNNC